MDIRHIKTNSNEDIWYDHSITPYDGDEDKTPVYMLHWHRIGGPAFISAEGRNIFYLDSNEYHFNEYCKLVKPLMTEEDYFIMILTYSGSSFGWGVNK